MPIVPRAMAETDYAVPSESRRTGRVVARVRRALLPHLIFYSGLLIGLLLLLLCAIVLYEGRIDARDRARTTQQNVALMASWDIERNIEIYSLSLQAVVDGANDPAVANLPMPLRRQVLFDRATTAKYLGGIYVLDANGDIAVDGKTDIPRKFNFANEAYFAVHRDHPDVGLYVSDPYHSRLRDGSLSIALSRRITRPDGSFGGVAVMSIRLEYFQNLFARLALGDRGSVALIKTNGRMVARQPYDPSIVGRDISHASTFRHFMTASEGSFTDTATIDGAPPVRVPPPREPAADPDGRARSRHLRRVVRPRDPDRLGDGRARDRLHRAVAAARRAVAQAPARGNRAAGARAHRRPHRARQPPHARRHARANGGAPRARSTRCRCCSSTSIISSATTTQGHQAGDDALAAVGRCIAGCLRRPADYAARYGGEEFVVVLPDVDTDGAVAIAETIRTGILDLGIRHDAGMCGRVTASIGVTTCYPERGDTIQAALKLADDALYRAKASGATRSSCTRRPTASAHRAAPERQPAGTDRRRAPQNRRQCRLAAPPRAARVRTAAPASDHHETQGEDIPPGHRAVPARDRRDRLRRAPAGDLARCTQHATIEAAYLASEGELKHYVELATSAIMPLYEASGRNGRDDAMLRTQALAMLQKMDFGPDGYFFVRPARQFADASARAERVGHNFWSMRDPQGALTMQQLIGAASHGGGYVRRVAAAVHRQDRAETRLRRRARSLGLDARHRHLSRRRRHRAAAHRRARVGEHRAHDELAHRDRADRRRGDRRVRAGAQRQRVAQRRRKAQAARAARRRIAGTGARALVARAA
jgi:diguanylate cyclase (GGDEF)-like protein